MRDVVAKKEWPLGLAEGAVGISAGVGGGVEYGVDRSIPWCGEFWGW